MEVLIAHGSESSRLALVDALEPTSLMPILAADGARALEILMRDEPPRLALIDWDLPDIEGPELCRLLRDFHLGTAPYIILLTPAGAPRDVRSGLLAGASDFVLTPVTDTELRSRVEYGQRVMELPWGMRQQDCPEDERGEGDPEGPARLVAMTTDEWASAFGV